MVGLWTKFENNPDPFLKFVEEAFENKTLDDEIRASGGLDEEAWKEMVVELRCLAATARSSSGGPDAPAVEAVTEVFMVPLVGNLAAIDAFILDENNVESIAASFQLLGLASRNSEVQIHCPALPTNAAIQVMPTQLRDLAQAFHCAFRGHAEGSRAANYILSAMASDHADEPRARLPGEMGGRLLICARARSAGEATEDYFGGRGTATAVSENEVPDVRLSAWLDEIATLSGGAECTFRVNPPCRWSDGLLSIAIASVNMALDAQARSLGISAVGPFELHIHEDQSGIWLAKCFGSTLLGPIEVQHGLVAGRSGEFMEAISKGFWLIREHETLGTMCDLSSAGTGPN